MNSGWRPKRSFIGQINDFWTSVTNIFPQNAAEVAVENPGHFDSAQDGEGDDDVMQVDDGGYFGEREVGDVGGMDSVQSEEGEAQA